MDSAESNQFEVEILLLRQLSDSEINVSLIQKEKSELTGLKTIISVSAMAKLLSAVFKLQFFLQVLILINHYQVMSACYRLNIYKSLIFRYKSLKIKIVIEISSPGMNEPIAVPACFIL